ncbi:DEAD/DEAH box helicase [Paraburkholderia nemoris]|uniref:DEAD/DEAH box helicase n=1 Tax=Paraburkholderia nemoris TaxID=2793076 RepID=UPI001B21277D|nr:DEAD/DEAH box helicase [Paraburkholderia nemoris]CAE6839568.1 hypothetical protein LMG22931_07184 [Paraburkholderia nemoris]
MTKPWKKLRPQDVSEWVNFDASDEAWQYGSGDPESMPAIQTEGVAYLWNLLAAHRVALLADEVGMGKTFQALGVAALLWRSKPDAKVLVMAPNRDICLHWQREFSSFTKRHYREADDRVKAVGSGDPAPAIAIHTRLRDLVEAIENQSDSTSSGSLYLTTIHSLSGLTESTDEKSNKQAEARKAAGDVHQQILRALDGEGFDLIVIDEAHYFRNPQGGSQRVAAAKAFFGDENSRIAKRALLLTATPSHTHLDDIGNILRYFIGSTAIAQNESAEELMRKYALRRFRRMAGNGVSFTKHQYRRELATACEFKDRPEAEMFFALYQRNLIHELGVLEERRRLLYGFLEGLESAGAESETSSAKSGDEEGDDAAKDFNQAADSKLLRNMAKQYRDIFGMAPDHPKYGQLVTQCAPPSLFPMPAERPLHEDKHLVFVRRIPSVRELTGRINEHYDGLLALEICAALGIEAVDSRVKDWRLTNWSREGFNKLLAAKPPSVADMPQDDDENTDAGEEADVHDGYLRSKIADLFVTKKASNDPSSQPTDCSRFSLSLRRAISIHAMFMEPASDYMNAPYRWHFEYRQSDKLRADYVKAAQVERMSKHAGFSRVAVEPPAEATRKDYDAPIETMWSLVFPCLSEGQRATLSRWAKEGPKIAENFANYIQAGFLFASPVIVELYGWHTRFERLFEKNESEIANAQQRYRMFVAYARKRIEGSLLLRYFGAALDTFEQLCEKLIDHKVDDWQSGWRTLTTLTNPAWYASGESSSRQHLILGFNSPFYPNTLVTTSVFQEGVNLHLQCRHVHHYGIAWTPGDNEQRVGRVDRLFGKVNGLLARQPAGSVTLDINYPYLKDSFDEDQLGSFIERKHAVEEKMDRCTQGSFDKGIRMTRPGWQAFLRQPIADFDADDPYAARFD